MKYNKLFRVLLELLLNDLSVGLFFWSLVLIFLLTFINLPHSLVIILYIFFSIVIIFCFPFVIYKIFLSIHLSNKGVKVLVTNVTTQPSYFGQKVRFDYEFDGNRYDNVKFYPAILSPLKNEMKLLVDPLKPSRYVILEFKKKTIFSILRDR